MPEVQIVADARPERIDQAAAIWAAATAARDSAPAVAGLEIARPIIADTVNGAPGSMLLVALADGRTPVGFAVAVPCDDRRAELRFLGVDPASWGRGVAGQLLDGVIRRLGERGYLEIELWVYADNDRAVALYRRCGWRPSADARTHPSSGRREQRYTLEIPEHARPPRSRPTPGETGSR